MSKSFIEIETLRAGQPRPYADSHYEYIVKFTMEKEWGPDKGAVIPMKVDMKRALFVSKVLLDFREEKDARNWADRILQTKEMLSEGVFRFFVVSTYTG